MCRLRMSLCDIFCYAFDKEFCHPVVFLISLLSSLQHVRFGRSGAWASTERDNWTQRHREKHNSVRDMSRPGWQAGIAGASTERTRVHQVSQGEGSD